MNGASSVMDEKTDSAKENQSGLSVDSDIFICGVCSLKFRECSPLILHMEAHFTQNHLTQNEDECDDGTLDTIRPECDGVDVSGCGDADVLECGDAGVSKCDEVEVFTITSERDSTDCKSNILRTFVPNSDLPSMKHEAVDEMAKEDMDEISHAIPDESTCRRSIENSCAENFIMPKDCETTLQNQKVDNFLSIHQVNCGDSELLPSNSETHLQKKKVDDNLVSSKYVKDNNCELSPQGKVYANHSQSISASSSPSGNPKCKTWENDSCRICGYSLSGNFINGKGKLESRVKRKRILRTETIAIYNRLEIPELLGVDRDFFQQGQGACTPCIALIDRMYNGVNVINKLGQNLKDRFAASHKNDGSDPPTIDLPRVIRMGSINRPASKPISGRLPNSASKPVQNERTTNYESGVETTLKNFIKLAPKGIPPALVSKSNPGYQLMHIRPGHPILPKS